MRFTQKYAPPLLVVHQYPVWKVHIFILPTNTITLRSTTGIFAGYILAITHHANIGGPFTA